MGAVGGSKRRQLCRRSISCTLWHIRGIPSSRNPVHRGFGLGTPLASAEGGWGGSPTSALTNLKVFLCWLETTMSVMQASSIPLTLTVCPHVCTEPSTMGPWSVTWVPRCCGNTNYHSNNLPAGQSHEWQWMKWVGKISTFPFQHATAPDSY